MSDKLQGGVRAGSTDVSWTIVLRATSDSTEMTGKAAADMTLSYLRQGGTRTAVAASDLAAVNSAHSDGGVKEIDATNMPGTYRVDWPDAAFAAGADWVQLTVKVAGAFVFNERVPLTTNVVQSGDAYARLGAPAGASVSADVAAVSSVLATIAGYLDTEIAAIKAKTDNLPSSPAATGDAMTLTAAYDFAKGTAPMTESYAANGEEASPIQLLYGLQQLLSMFSISGTSLTVKKLDGVTTAFVVTLDDAETPTGAART
ncbi:MAG: hypothetical protein ACM31O_14090 [Bacteroidota bacterium]